MVNPAAAATPTAINPAGQSGAGSSTTAGSGNGSAQGGSGGDSNHGGPRQGGSAATGTTTAPPSVSSSGAAAAGAAGASPLIAGTSTPANAPAGAPAPATPVSLANLADAAKATITMSAKSPGVTQARIELSPDSLGDIQIHLQHTADGLVARVITAHPEAAQTLQASSDELRRSLEQNGTPLLRLDISTSDRGGQHPAAGENGSRTGGASSRTEDEPITDSTSPERVADLSGSALVNVLA